MASHTYRANDSRRRKGDLAADSNRLRDLAAEKEPPLRSTSPRTTSRRPAAEKNSYYPPDLGPDTGRPGFTHSSRQPPPRRRKPYQAVCEDEVPSLAKEAGKQALLGADEVKQRGTIDQEPVIQDIAGPPPSNTARRDNRKGANGILTPDTSEDEREKRRRHCETGGSVPDIARRSASPYAFVKAPKLGRDLTAERFLSPDTLTPPNTDSPGRRSRQAAPSSAPSSPCQSPSARKGNDYFSSTPVREGESGRPANSNLLLPIREPHFEGRRYTDTSETLPTVRRLKLDKSRRPTPLVASSALSELGDNPGYTASPGSMHSVEDVSPRPASVNQLPNARLPTSSSPRLSMDGSVIVSSAASSRAASLSGSRPPSPRTSLDSPRIPKTDLDWSNLLAANAARRRPAARPTPLLRQETMPEYTRPTLNSLPYPVDDGPPNALTYMPSEHEHAAPSPIITSQPAFGSTKDSSGSQSPYTPISSFNSTAPVLSRTNTATRFATAAGPLVAGTRPASDIRSSVSLSSDAKREIAALLRKGLPPCTRIRPKSGYDDWYTVIGANELDICPNCVSTVFERTIYRPALRRSPPRSLSTKIQCALGSSPWVRLAWTLTLQQQRTDLALLKAVAEINDCTEECPGNAEAERTWYGLRDTNGLLVREFFICHRDARVIERILPSLTSIFVRLPSNKLATEKPICAFRADSNRLPDYLEALTAAQEKAVRTGKAVDPMPLVDLVEHKTRLRECTRDNLLLGALWHYPESVRELTVCEDCFDLIVEPEIRRRSEVALSFNRAVAPAYGEGMGSSCQLYSPYMRKCFQRAVRDRDFRYLARKARERREVELRLQTRYKDIMRRYKRLSREGDLTNSEERRFQRDLEKIANEWAEVE